MKNETTNTATGIHCPYMKEIIILDLDSNSWTKTINVKTPNGIRSYKIYHPEKYAELIRAEDVDKVVYNGFEFENTVDNEGN